MAEIEVRPKGLRRQPGGIWEIDKWINGRRIKRSTQSTDLEVAKAVLARETAMLNERAHGSEWSDAVDKMLQDPRSWLRRMAQSIAYRGRKTGKGCTVTAEDLAQVLRRSGGRCEVTGIGLDLRRGERGETPPFHPSFDRRDSRLGYTYANTRVVCLCVNLCIRDWGEAVMHRIGRAMALREWAELTKPHLAESSVPTDRAKGKRPESCNSLSR